MVLTGPKTNRPSESGHWYDRDGTPRYEVAAASGKGPRAATLKDARKFGWYPGVTSIIRMAAAPGLEIWKQKQVLLAARTIPHIEGETDEQLIARILTDAGEEARKARDRGTEIHAAVQGYYEGQPPPEDLLECVRGIVAQIDANFPERKWRTEIPVAHQLGFGTKVDLSCDDIILDFKGAEFDEIEAASLKTWDEHHMQLGAGREALRQPGAIGGIVYVSRNVPGLCRVCLVDEDDLQRGWDMFRGLLNYWKANKRYYPELWKAKEAA